MRIAILGTRGIPARYGGFETFAEELSSRLAARGHKITVYCRARYPEQEYRGVELRYVPAIRSKHMETVTHTLLSTIHLLGNRPDAALYCNAANAICTWVPRLAGVPVALNVDGLERKRKKWGKAGKTWYAISEWLSTFCPNNVVSDAERIADYYRHRYGKQTTFIPYGAETGRVRTHAVLGQLNLEPGRYFLYVSRLEPENNALLVREAFESVETDLKLALIGDAPYAAGYIRKVRDTRDARIAIPGAIYGDGYKELGSHCFAYVHATEVGGTHPALIEAMGRGALTLYLDTPENAEVAAGAAIPFRRDNLADKMREVLAMPEAERRRLGELARQRVEERYSWDSVTDAYERLLAGMIGRAS